MHSSFRYQLTITAGLTLALIGLSAAPAIAQSVPGTDPDGDETILVTGSRLGGVSADRIGASVTVLDEQALRERQTRIVSDVLRDVPGVEVSRTGAVGGLTQVRMRGGEGNHTLVLIDGIEASDPFQGEFDFGGLLAEENARIEVLRGQQSALYGSDAIGGVIHYITASGRERPGVSARAEYGSFDSAAAAARLGGVAGALDYAFSAGYNRTDGYPVAVGGVRDLGAETFTASTKINVEPAPNFRVQTVWRYSRTEADTSESSPTTYAPIDGTGNYTSRSLMGLVRAQLDLLDGRWSHAITGQVNDNRRISYADEAQNTRSSANEGTRLKASYDTRFTFGTNAVQHAITLAADFEREEFRNLPPAGPQPLSATRRIDNTGLVADYRLSLGDRFNVGGSVRRDDNDRFDNVTTYRTSASLKVIEPLRIRAAYGTGIKNPTPFELYGFSNLTTVFIGNPDLKPEKSKGWEAGADLASPDGRFSIGATYFDSKLKNEIFSNYVGGVSSPGNRLTDSTQKGVEIFAAARIGETLRVDAAYTHLKARENGAEEIRRAPNIASLNVTWRPVEPLSLTGTIRYNGRTYDSNFTLLPGYGPRVRLDEFTLVNLAADYRLAERVSLFARVENLFDEHYTEVFGYRTPGRGAYGGIRVSF